MAARSQGLRAGLASERGEKGLQPRDELLVRGECVGEHVLGSHGAAIEDEHAVDELALHAMHVGFAEGAGDGKQSPR